MVNCCQGSVPSANHQSWCDGSCSFGDDTMTPNVSFNVPLATFFFPIGPGNLSWSLDASDGSKKTDSPQGAQRSSVLKFLRLGWSSAGERKSLGVIGSSTRR